MKKVIWRPSITNSYDFGVYFDRDFAREMIKSKISPERKKRMNEIGNKELKRMNRFWLNPYIFHEESCFVDQVNIGGNGVWLATDCNNIESLLRDRETDPIEYHSHNVDTSHEAYVLMALFDRWVDLSDALKEV